MRKLRVLRREFWIWIIRTLLLGVGLCALIYYFAEPFPRVLPYLLLGAAIMTAFACVFVLPVRFSTLRITEERGNLTVSGGWLFPYRKTVSLRSAALVQLRRTPLQRLLRTATVVLRFSGGQVTLHGISVAEAEELIVRWEKRRRI